VPIRAPLTPLVLEKMLFFVLAVASSVVTVFAQRRGGAVIALDALPWTDRAANALISIVNTSAIDLASAARGVLSAPTPDSAVADRWRCADCAGITIVAIRVANIGRMRSSAGSGMSSCSCP
jgi:hypothetical protein